MKMSSRFPPNDPKAAIAWLKALNKTPRPIAGSSATPEPITPKIISHLAELARPRVDDVEAIKKLEANGVKVLKISNESYSLRSKRGHLIFEGARPSDELFTVNPLGSMNISKAWRIINSASPSVVYRMPIDGSLLHELSGGDVELKPLQEMTDSRRDVPVLFIHSPQRGMFLVDGSHRLLSRAMKKLPWVDGFIVPDEALRDIRVKVWKVSEDFVRTEIDTTEGYSSIFG